MAGRQHPLDTSALSLSLPSRTPALYLSSSNNVLTSLLMLATHHSHPSQKVGAARWRDGGFQVWKLCGGCWGRSSADGSTFLDFFPLVISTTFEKIRTSYSGNVKFLSKAL